MKQISIVEKKQSKSCLYSTKIYDMDERFTSNIESHIEGNIESHIETQYYIIMKRLHVIQGQWKVIESEGACSNTRLFDGTVFTPIPRSSAGPIICALIVA